MVSEVDFAKYESDRRSKLIAERIAIEDQISVKYAEIRVLQDSRNAVVSEIMRTMNITRYEPPVIKKPEGYGITGTGLDLESRPRGTHRFIDRFLGRVTGSLRARG